MAMAEALETLDAVTGGAGGGWFSDGAGLTFDGGGGGLGPDGLFAGGTGREGGNGLSGSDGGFGGGGGGGYSGGGAGSLCYSGGGGGGSYLDSSVTLNSAITGANSGYGYVEITDVSDTPEPASSALLGSGLVTLALARRGRLSAQRI
jgi:hypothetical protein